MNVIREEYDLVISDQMWFQTNDLITKLIRLPLIIGQGL